MPNYRQIRNGFISLNVGEADLAVVMRNLKSYVRSAQADFKVKIHPLSIRDAIKQIRLLTGSDFKSFLMANYNNGVGPQAGMVREIVYYLRNKVSHRSVSTQLLIEEGKVTSYNSDPKRWEAKPVNIQTMTTQNILELDKVTEYDFYRLVAGTSPEIVSRIFLTIAGESPDVLR